jgi:hypothetical protein
MTTFLQDLHKIDDQTEQPNLKDSIAAVAQLCKDFARGVHKD